MSGRFCHAGKWVAGTAVIAAVACIGGSQAHATDEKPLAGYITASDVATNATLGVRGTDRLRGYAGAIIATSNSSYEVTSPRTKPSSGQRWEKFNAEFGIQEKSLSPVKGALQDAKYQLDSAAFAAKDFAKEVEERVSFDYELRNLGSAPPRSKTLRPIYDTPFEDMFDNARFKSDIKLGTDGDKAFAGVRLVLPFGD